MKIKTRFATMEDLKDIQDLSHKLHIKENKEFDATINKDYPIQKLGEIYFKKRIKNDCALVAFVKEEVAGYLVGAIHEPEDYRNISNVAEAENMLVLEKYRSLGIGKQLFQEFIKWSQSKGAKRIRVVASAQNIKAIEFYKREGFKEYDLTLEKDI